MIQFPLQSTDIPWETKLGVLLGAKVFIDCGNCDENFLTVLGPSGIAFTFSGDEIIRG
jgi:hypothetical protein